MASYDWIVGIAVIFGLAFVFAFYTDWTFETILVFVAIFDAFMVWAGVLPFWTLILCIIIVFILVYRVLQHRSVISE